jgi:hypothetical protein
MIVCPACGRPTETGWTTCLNCGKALNHSRVQPGQQLPPREQPVAEQPPQQQAPQYQQPQYQQQQYQQPYQQPKKSCLGRFILWLVLAFVLWYLITHFIPAMADLHLLFENEYTTPQEVGAWFARLIP